MEIGTILADMELCPQKKVLFLALAVCIAFSVIFAENIIADDHDHDCTGEGCPFCLGIETVYYFLISLKLGAFAVFLAVCPVLFIQTPIKRTECTISLHSPVALKVRFNS
jgi:hypothetical protein